MYIACSAVNVREFCCLHTYEFCCPADQVCLLGIVHEGDIFAEPQVGHLCLVHAVHNTLGSASHAEFKLEIFNQAARKLKLPSSNSVKFAVYGAANGVWFDNLTLCFRWL